MIERPKRTSGVRAEGRIRARNRMIILRAAQQVFAKKGFDGTAIAGIAEASGLPKANVYYYFKSKEGVYRAVIAALLSEWNDAFDHIAEDRDPAEAIEAYVRAKLEYSRRNMAASKIFADENLRGSAFLSPRELKSIRTITREKASVVTGWIKAGKLKAVDPIHFFITLWASTQFYADFDSLVCNVLGTRRLKRADFDAAARTITALVLDGCNIRSIPKMKR
jgi:AcrR family transcriptional regulator